MSRSAKRLRHPWHSDSDGDEKCVPSEGANQPWDEPSGGEQDLGGNVGHHSDDPDFDGEQDLDGFAGLVYDSDSDAGDIGRDSGENQAIHFCVSLLLMRVLSAKTFCTLMYYLGLAGLKQCGKLGLNPSSRSGHFYRKVRRSLHLYSKVRLYTLSVPRRSAQGLARTTREVLVHPPHEQVDKYRRSNPRCIEQLRALRDTKRLPQSYYHHHVYRRNSDRDVFPFALFVDGLPYSLVDSYIESWLQCLLSGRRFLLAVLRKSIVCRCGCRSCCTYWAV